jgi:hypothetical protein
MNIGIDLRPLALGASGGIAIMLRGVLQRLLEDHPLDRFLVFCTVYNRGLLDCARPNVRFLTLPTRDFYRQLDAIAQRESVDVLFRSYPITDNCAFPLARQIVVMPDLQHEEHPEFFDAGVLRVRRAAFGRFLRDAGAIGTISQHARNTILSRPQTRCRDVFLMPPALTIEHQPTTGGDLTDAERALVPAVPYFLFPANLWPHKNHRRLLAALRIVTSRTARRIQLVLSGHVIEGAPESLCFSLNRPLPAGRGRARS